METAALPTRRTGRVLLVDDDERVLLFRCWLDADRKERGHIWITPGGGMHPGETLEEAAARELHEETGLSLAPADLGPVVAWASGEWQWRDTRFLAVDTFFSVRIPSLTVDTTGFQSVERGLLTAHRWWTRPEIQAATEPIFPLNLAP